LVFPDSTFNHFDEANPRAIITSGTLLNFLVVKAGCWNLGKGWVRLVCIPESLSGYRISGLDWPRFGSPTRQHSSSGPKRCPSRLIHHSINWLGFPCSLSSARDQALYFMASISRVLKLSLEVKKTQVITQRQGVSYVDGPLILFRDMSRRAYIQKGWANLYRVTHRDMRSEAQTKHCYGS
jgi:hypothetical protein